MNLFSLGGVFSKIWMDLWIALNSVVYQVIKMLYEVFEAIANVNLFSKEAFNDITSRLYVVIGIAMLFIFAYNIILMIINPDDKKSTGNTGKVVKETIIALVLVILLPRIFNYMSIFQRNILDSHILEQIILGDTAGTEVECDFSDLKLIDNYVKVDGSSAVAEMTSQCNNYQQLKSSKKGAYLVAPTIFTAFFHPTNYGYDECVNYLIECKDQGTNCVSNDGLITTDDDKELCARYVYDTNISQFRGGITEFTEMKSDVYSKAWRDTGILDFNYLMAFVAGIIAVIMFFRYSLAIGVRVAKLGFFQIISPIPVMMRIIPKQKEAFYDKWFKHLVEEYLDVFVRLAIIYFALFAISLVPDVMDSLFASLTGNKLTKGLAAVVVILGILKFAGDAPDLIKEFFGNSGRYALKGVRQQLGENKYAKGVLGGTASLATVKANQFRNLKKDWTSDKATFGSRAKQLGRLINPVGGFKSGFDASKDATSMDAWGKGIKDGSVEYLKDKGFVYNARKSLSNTYEDLKNVSGKSYLTQDTAGLQRTSDELSVIADNAKLILGSLEEDPKFKGLISVYDQAIKDATKSNPGIVDALTKEKVDAMNALRSKLMVEKLTGKEANIRYEKDGDILKAIIENNREATKGISTELKATLDNLSSSIKDNFDTFNDTVIESKTELKTEFGESLKLSSDKFDVNSKELMKALESGDTKLIKAIKTVADDGAKAAKANMINIEKKDK